MDTESTEKSPYKGAAHKALVCGIEREVDQTMQVAIMLVSEATPAEIRERLGLLKTEYDMCILRLQRVSGHWRAQ